MLALALAPMMNRSMAMLCLFMILGMTLDCMPSTIIGAGLSAPFPTQARESSASLTFNPDGFFAASIAPFIATWLQIHCKRR